MQSRSADPVSTVKAVKARKIKCGCGAEVSSRNMARHCRQAKHRRWLEEAERVGPALS